MVGHISCRTGIPGIKNIADHIRLILAGNKENKIPENRISFKQAKPSVKNTDSGKPATASKSSTAN